MYTMHSHSTLCRCQFFSCNTNTLLEITGLSPAGGIQTAYNLSIVNLFASMLYILEYLMYLEDLKIPLK